MGYCVLHCRKGKNGDGLGNHIDRTVGYEYSYRDSDETRRDLNENFASDKFQNLSLNAAAALRISEGYSGTTAIRKDAVRFVETIFSGSHDDMINIQKDKKAFNRWKEKTIDFAKATFGEENIIRMSLHLDEETPHFHCVSVPLIDGRLSAKKLLTKTSLAIFQTNYALEMAEFGLKRGELGSEAVHNSQTEYNANLIYESKKELDDFKVKINEQRALLSELILKNEELSIKTEKLALNEAKSLRKEQMDIYNEINTEWVRKFIINPEKTLYPNAKRTQIEFLSHHPNFEKINMLGKKINELENINNKPGVKLEALQEQKKKGHKRI